MLKNEGFRVRELSNPKLQLTLDKIYMYLFDTLRNLILIDHDF